MDASPISGRDPALPEPRYGGFWIRLAAGILDTLIFFPISALVLWGPHGSRGVVLSTVFLSHFGYAAFVIYCVGRWGGTPGKLIVGLQIVRTDLQRAGWKEAWARHSVDLAFSIVGFGQYMYSLQQIPDHTIAELTRSQLSQELSKLDRLPDTIMLWAGQIWIWGELIVLLSNRQRRALHDFIAGTVVIRKRPPRQKFTG